MFPNDFQSLKFFLSQKITFHAVVKSQLHSVQHHVLLYFLANSWTLLDTFASYFISNTVAITNSEIYMKPTTLFRLESTSTLHACCNISISVLWQNVNCLVFSWALIHPPSFIRKSNSSEHSSSETVISVFCLNIYPLDSHRNVISFTRSGYVLCKENLWLLW